MSRTHIDQRERTVRTVRTPAGAGRTARDAPFINLCIYIRLGDKIVDGNPTRLTPSRTRARAYFGRRNADVIAPYTSYIVSAMFRSDEAERPSETPPNSIGAR